MVRIHGHAEGWRLNSELHSVHGEVRRTGIRTHFCHASIPSLRTCEARSAAQAGCCLAGLKHSPCKVLPPRHLRIGSRTSEASDRMIGSSRIAKGSGIGPRRASRIPACLLELDLRQPGERDYNDIDPAVGATAFRRIVACRRMILSVPSNRHPVGIDAGLTDQHHSHSGRSCS